MFPVLGGSQGKFWNPNLTFSKCYRFWGGPVENFEIPNLLLLFSTNFLVKKVTDICLFWAFFRKKMWNFNRLSPQSGKKISANFFRQKCFSTKFIVHGMGVGCLQKGQKPKITTEFFTNFGVVVPKNPKSHFYCVLIPLCRQFLLLPPPLGNIKLYNFMQ